MEKLSKKLSFNRAWFSRWEAFLFARETPYAMAALRIVFGVLTFIELLSVYHSWLWVSPTGAASVTTGYDDPGAMWIRPIYSLFEAIDPTAALRAALVPFGLIALILVTLGLFTRFSLWVAAIAILGQASRGIPSLEGSFELMKWIAVVLLFSPAGKVLSLDSLLRTKRGKKAPVPRLEPVLPKRVLQFLLCTVYLSTFSWKLLSPEWRNGSAVYYAGHMHGFLFLTPAWLFEHHWLSSAFTYGTLLLELSLATLIWVRPLRKWLLGIGFLFHLGLALSLDIPLFQEIQVALYLLFIDEAAYLKLRSWWSSPSRNREPKAERSRPAHRPASAAAIAIACALWLFFCLPNFYRMEELRASTFEYKPYELFELTLTWPMFFRIPQWTGSLRIEAKYADGSQLMIDRTHLAAVGLDDRLDRLHFWHWAIFRTHGLNTPEKIARFVRQSGPVFMKLLTRGGVRPVSIDFVDWVIRTPDYNKPPGRDEAPSERRVLIGSYTDPTGS